MQAVKLKLPRLSRAEMDRRTDQFLKEIQKTLMPDHASEYVAINLETGEYALGRPQPLIFEWLDHISFTIEFLCN